jgi:hypothetical protein
MPTYDAELASKIDNLALYLLKQEQCQKEPSLCNQLRTFTVDDNRHKRLAVFKDWFLTNIQQHIPHECGLVVRSMMKDYNLDYNSFKPEVIEVFSRYLCCFKDFIIEGLEQDGLYDVLVKYIPGYVCPQVKINS